MGLSSDPSKNSACQALGSPIVLKVGNLEPMLVANLFAPDGTPASLPGVVTFRMRDVVTRQNVVTAGPVTIQDPGAARVAYAWEAAATARAGVYEAFFDHTNAGRVETFPNQGAMGVRIEP